MSGIFGRWGRSKHQNSHNGASAANGATSADTSSAVVTASPPAPPAAPPEPPVAPASNGTATLAAATFPSTIMDFQLTLRHVVNRAQELYPQREVVTNTEAGRVRTTYGAIFKRVNRLAGALARLGVKRGDRVATLGWNTASHLEAYYAISCMGAVLHTLNLRLSPQDLAYIINDAQDSIILVDSDLVPLLARIADQLQPVRSLLVMNGTAQVPDGVTLPPILDYEELLAAESESYPWPALDEREAAAMCYTSGTTGNPKGVVYSHRSIMLHSLVGGLPDVLSVSERDIVMPFVPMFHANAWGLAHSAPMYGASLIFPGRLMDPVNVTKLISDEHVTLAAGVPTIWIGMLQVLNKDPGAYDLSALQRIICGGSAVPLALIEGLQALNLNIIQAWGMTEMSPLGSVARVRREYADLPLAEQNVRARAKAGVPAPLVEFRVVDDSGQQVPWDGKTFGELQVRGPWITGSYYHGGDDNVSKFSDGWLRTGDVVTLDENGYIGIVDRTKDVIKSGGEWISSVDLENMIMGHPQVLEAAVIGVPHPKWQERPVAYVVPKPDAAGTLTAEDIIAYLEPRVAKWWLPDEVIFIDAVPKTSVGKFDKKVLRARWAADHNNQG
jgi:fatty-acyl-CoA synthase